MTKPVQIDTEMKRVWYGMKLLKLTNKPFAILQYLIENRDRMVTREELSQAVWKGTSVSGKALDGHLKNLRQQLGEKPGIRQHTYIQTIHGEGFRFIGPVQGQENHGPKPTTSTPGILDPTTFITAPPSPFIVGHDQESHRLDRLWNDALNGESQLVFVTGEPGIGKTTLVDGFLQRVSVSSSPLIGMGMCTRGSQDRRQPYEPILEALEQLGNGPAGPRVRAAVANYAPSWLPFVSWSGVAATSTSREALLHQFVNAFAALATEMPVILCLEDLHWSDESTMALLSKLAGSRAQRLLILCTYRSTEEAANAPLATAVQDMLDHRHCEVVAMKHLTADDVAQYLAKRWPVHAFPPDFADHLHRRTGGNPLFLVNLLDRLLVDEERGVGRLTVSSQNAVRAMPQGIRDTIISQFQRLTPVEQLVLEIASVSGMTCSAAVLVDKDLSLTAEAGETSGLRLAQRGLFLQAQHEIPWPSGTTAMQFRFLHDLYREAVYEQIPPLKRQRLHRHLRERLEEGYTGQTTEIAADLAWHCEQAHDYENAVRYRQEASQAAIRRYGYNEAAFHLQQAAQLLLRLPESSERVQQELQVQMALGQALSFAYGFAWPEVESAYERARELCGQLDRSEHTAFVTVTASLFGLWCFHCIRGNLQQAEAIAEQLLELAIPSQDPAMLAQAHHTVGAVAMHRGDFQKACEHQEQAFTWFRHAQSDSAGPPPGFNSTNIPHGYASISLWLFGYTDQALTCASAGLELAHHSEASIDTFGSAYYVILAYLLRREEQRALTLASDMLAAAEKYEARYMEGMGRLDYGYALVQQGEREGITYLKEGIDGVRAAGTRVGLPLYLSWQAEAYLWDGQTEAGLAVIDEAVAVVKAIDEHDCEADLYRLKGELLLQLHKRGM